MRRVGELQPVLVNEIKPVPVEEVKAEVQVEIGIGVTMEEPTAVSAVELVRKKKKGKKNGKKKKTLIVDDDANEGNLEDIDDKPMFAPLSIPTEYTISKYNQIEYDTKGGEVDWNALNVLNSRQAPPDLSPEEEMKQV